MVEMTHTDLFLLSIDSEKVVKCPPNMFLPVSFLQELCKMPDTFFFCLLQRGSVPQEPLSELWNHFAFKTL